MSIAGSYCFVALPKSVLTRAIGVVIIVCVTLKWRGLLEFEMTSRRLAAAGAVVGFLSGLVGSAGPFGAAAFLSLNLAPVSYIAAEATTAVAMHASKMLVYEHFISFDATAWKLAGILSVGMVLGSWLGKKTVERLSVEKFRTVVGCLLIALALQMLVAG